MFSSNWFDTLAKDNFENIIKPLFTSKDIKYLEIGCFEGASLHYMFTNVMVNTNSTATIIDPFIFYDTQLQTFTNNMQNYKDRFDLIIGYSQHELSKLNPNYYDFIYIDGDHTSDAVFTDAVLSFPLLKNGGIIIFDDYLWIHNDSRLIPDINNINLSHPNNPFSGINKFLELYKDSIEIIASNWQMVIRKI